MIGLPTLDTTRATARLCPDLLTYVLALQDAPKELEQLARLTASRVEQIEYDPSRDEYLLPGGMRVTRGFLDRMTFRVPTHEEAVDHVIDAFTGVPDSEFAPGWWCGVEREGRTDGNG